jgi:hypothetical protein
MSSSHIWAANFVPSPTLGISPVIGALIPILIVFDLLQTEGAKTRQITRHETTKMSLFFMVILLFSI